MCLNTKKKKINIFGKNFPLITTLDRHTLSPLGVFFGYGTVFY